MNKVSTYAISVLLGVTLLTVIPAGDLGAQTPGGESSSPADPSLGLDTASPIESWRAGIYLGLNRMIYTADDLQGLPGVPTCSPGFDQGGGLGVAVGAMAEKPLNDWFSIGGRLYINTYNGGLIYEETVVVDDEGYATDGVFQHRIDADIWATSIEPVAVFGLSDDAKFFTGLRGDVIVRKLYKQEERIIEPETIVFENNRNVRMEYEGSIPGGTAFHGSVVAGFRYDFYVDPSRQWVIAPEISGWYALTPVVSDESWKAHGIRIAIIGQYLRYEQEEHSTGDIDISGPLDIDEDLSFETIGGPSETETESGISGTVDE